MDYEVDTTPIRLMVTGEKSDQAVAMLRREKGEVLWADLRANGGSTSEVCRE